MMIETAPERIAIVFFGTAELACPSLAALSEHPQIEVAAVVTQPDRPKGRDLKLQPSPVKVEAMKRQLPVLQPEKARRPEFVSEVARYKPGLIVVAAYGQILPASLLELPAAGCLNVHTSLLPKYRGAAPIQWAILNDEPQTGVTIMKMDAGLDTGGILTQEPTVIERTDTAQTLHDRLAELGAALLIQTIPDYLAGRIQPRPQSGSEATYARKITREDGRLDWALPGRTLWNRVRGLTPWPGAWTLLPDAAVHPLVKVWEAEPAEGKGEPGEVLRADKDGIVIACGPDSLRITKLQREGGRRMSAAEFLAGHPMRAGQRFS
jgi:methionyl-tRNA formyltransferase